jgi:predicted transcriptional regulator
MLDEAVFTAADLMTRDVAVVHPETSLLEAVKLMAIVSAVCRWWTMPAASSA